MIDIHTHILPGVDDGANDLEVTDQMLRMAAGDGVTGIVATPHADLHYEFDPARCGEIIEEIRHRCPDFPRIYTGCEVHLTPENIEKVVRQPKHFTLGGGNCLLLELPNTMLPQMVEPVLEILSGSGLRVIIAHPERNSYIQRRPGYADHLVEAGCYLQLTAQSINGGFGSHAENLSTYILNRKLAHFVASDAHSATIRRPLLSAVFRKIAHRFGNAAAQTLFVHNPGAALSGAALRRMPAQGNWLTSLLSRRSDPLAQQTSSSHLS